MSTCPELLLLLLVYGLEEPSGQTSDSAVCVPNAPLLWSCPDRMLPEILEILPKDDAEAYEGHTFRSCAVVGNSGVARMTAYGADIDGHDAVFRYGAPSRLRPQPSRSCAASFPCDLTSLLHLSQLTHASAVSFLFTISITQDEPGDDGWGAAWVPWLLLMSCSSAARPPMILSFMHRSS